MATASMEALPFYSLDDDSFSLEIFELNNGQINFDKDRFMSVNYNPLLASANQHLDLNFSCDYLNEDHESRF